MSSSPISDVASLAALVEKAGVVVVDIGGAYTKVGYAGEQRPRVISPSVFVLPDGCRLDLQGESGARASELAWRKALERHLKDIFYGSLGISGGSHSSVALNKRKAKKESASEGESKSVSVSVSGSGSELESESRAENESSTADAQGEKVSERESESRGRERESIGLSPKERERESSRSGGGNGFSVLVIESALLPLPFRKALSFVLFERLFAEKVSYWLSEASALLSLPLLPLPSLSPSSSLSTQGEALGKKEKQLLSARLHSSALVLDMGCAYSRALPVVDGVALLSSLVVVPTAARAIHRRLRALLREHCRLERPLKPHSNAELPSPAMATHVLEDILVRLCFVCLRGYSSDTVPELRFVEPLPSLFNERSSGALEQESVSSPLSSEGMPDTVSASPSLRRRSERDIVEEENKRVGSVAYTLADGSVLHVSGYVRAQATAVLFENTEEHPSLPSAILDALLATPVDARLRLAHSLLLSGGVAQLAGLPTRLLEELEELLSSPKYSALAHLSGNFHFLGSDVEPRLRPWVGGSIAGSLQEFAAVVTLEKYLSTVNCLPEWTQANGAAPHAKWRR